MPLRLILDEPAGAAWNMAVDEALLLAATMPTLRLYGWNPHAVSLGYFQHFEHFADLPVSVPIVRRLTGGGAIHHGDEVTFALTIDAADLTTDIDASYRVLHDAAIAALASVGVRSARQTVGPTAGARPTDRWCFAVPGRDDVVTSRGKLLGSAQRRIAMPRPRVLHHGSIVLRRPSLTPFVAATEDHVHSDPAFATRLQEALGREVARALSLRPEPGTLTAEESALAAQLAAGRYADPAHLRRY